MSERVRILNEMAERYINQPRTFIIRKWLDDSLNITDRKRKRYTAKWRKAQ